MLTATDTVAAISVVKEKKYPKLNSILFGEGVINDAVSIVLFRAVSTMGDSFGVLESLQLLWSFLYICIASIIVGSSAGLLCSLLLNRTPNIRENPERESGLVIMLGYLSYIFAELLDLSGIMTIFVCGVVMAHYAWYNMSKES